MSRSPARKASRTATRQEPDSPPESDRFRDLPHPRETYQLYGHSQAERSLLTAYNSSRLAQSWIIGGREGIGKATLAWRFARYLMAHPVSENSNSLFDDDAASQGQNLHIDPDHPQARLVHAGSHGNIAVLRREWDSRNKRHFTDIRVDDVRKTIQRFQHSAASDGWRIAIIDSAEDLNRNAANALLKIIEEPPPRSLFFIISHRPANILATIRSRSQMLHVHPLSEDNMKSAIHNLGPPWSETAEDELQSAIDTSGGSVQDALRSLFGAVQSMGRFNAIMDQMPALDWEAIHDLADHLSSRAQTEDYEAVIAGVFDWMSKQLHDLAHQPQTQAETLAPLADLWEKIASSARQVDIYNLDRKAFLLTLFSDLAEATPKQS